MTQEELDKREQRSKELQVFKVNDNKYFVESSKKQISYKVLLQNGQFTCTCGDFANNSQKDEKFKCKHILAIENGNGNIKSIANKKPKLDERWITRIRHKEFVLYSGLLDVAHQIGLKSINVELIQFPTKDNGYEAICRAITHSKDGQMFVDFGDANPKNTNSLVANHILRVAATRAKARTLRDMTNIGMTCMEELGGDEVSQNTSKKPQETHKQDNKDTKSNPPANNGKPSSAQINAIKNLAYRRGLNDKDIEKLCEEKLNTAFHQITSDQASRFIKNLQQSA